MPRVRDVAATNTSCVYTGRRHIDEAFLRAYAFDFMQVFAAPLTREGVELARASPPDELFDR